MEPYANSRAIAFKGVELKSCIMKSVTASKNQQYACQHDFPESSLYMPESIGGRRAYREIHTFGKFTRSGNSNIDFFDTPITQFFTIPVWGTVIILLGIHISMI